MSNTRTLEAGDGQPATILLEHLMNALIAGSEAGCETAEAASLLACLAVDLVREAVPADRAPEAVGRLCAAMVEHLRDNEVIFTRGEMKA
jgi:hypothetical protein